MGNRGSCVGPCKAIFRSLDFTPSGKEPLEDLSRGGARSLRGKGMVKRKLLTVISVTSDDGFRPVRRKWLDFGCGLEIEPIGSADRCGV